MFSGSFYVIECVAESCLKGRLNAAVTIQMPEYSLLINYSDLKIDFVYFLHILPFFKQEVVYFVLGNFVKCQPSPSFFQRSASILIFGVVV
jgi:hypothetical protein